MGNPDDGTWTALFDHCEVAGVERRVGVTCSWEWKLKSNQCNTATAQQE